MRFIEIINRLGTLSTMAIPMEVCAVALEHAMLKVNNKFHSGHYDLYVHSVCFDETKDIIREVRQMYCDSWFDRYVCDELDKDGWILVCNRKAIYSQGA